MLFSPVNQETMRMAMLISMVAVAAFVGSQLLGRYAIPVRYGVAIAYVGAILVLAGYHFFSQ